MCLSEFIDNPPEKIEVLDPHSHVRYRLFFLPDEDRYKSEDIGAGSQMHFKYWSKVEAYYSQTKTFK